LLICVPADHSPIEVVNNKEATLAEAGIAFHHGGLEQPARKRIEDGFRSGQLMIIVSTSTLAVGVNLPAHTVIVVGTKCWVNGGTYEKKHRGRSRLRAKPRFPAFSGMEEYSDLDMQQMIGRAGRPQYDTHGQVVVSRLASTATKS
jgi:ATP-dependent DNA helicase HFM1/MER3